ncbi:MAG: chromate transporter [Acetobacteraceae bacterium]
MSETTLRPTLGGLFMGFFSVGICGFGGVLPWARRMIVEQRRWLTPAEFTDMLGLCQFLPGPNVINISVALGGRFHGPLGSLSAFTGLMAAPMAIVLTLVVIYDRFAALPAVRDTFAGLAATASALVLSMALKIAAPLRVKPWGIAAALLTLGGIIVLHWPLPLVLGIMAPVSILLAHRRML